MKCIGLIFKNVLRMIIFLLGLSISLTQIYIIGFESTVGTVLDGNCGMNTQGLVDAGIKCSLAFLAGGLVSELRFMKFGLL